MDFSNIKKWMQKMNNILELYGKDESFTQSEKNLLLDYNQKIREAISSISVEDSEEHTPIINHVSSVKVEDSPINKTFDKLSEVISNHVSENNAIPRSGS